MTRRKTRRASSWSKSAAWKAIARKAVLEFNRKRPLLPKCGARRKSDLSPCRNLAMKNGRCYLHGGRSPSGDGGGYGEGGWHQHVWPDKSSPNANIKLMRKLKKIDIEARRLDKRIAAMSEDERLVYEKWRATHRPGSAAARKRAKAEAKQDKETKQLVTTPTPTRTPDPEVAAIDAQITELQQILDRHLAKRSVLIDVDGQEGNGDSGPSFSVFD